MSKPTNPTAGEGVPDLLAALQAAITAAKADRHPAPDATTREVRALSQTDDRVEETDHA